MKIRVYAGRFRIFVGNFVGNFVGHFGRKGETVKTVEHEFSPHDTSLKQGVNEKAGPVSDKVSDKVQDKVEDKVR